MITGLENRNGAVELIVDGQRRVFDGAWACPGFTDAHGHLYGLGSKLLGLNLEGASSADECIERAKLYDRRRSGWVYGFGWNNELWQCKVFPGLSALDAAFPDAPVFLSRIDGHAAWVNSAALRSAGIDENTIDPDGGKIIRFANGKPTGILLDNAMNPVRNLIEKPANDEIERRLLAAANELLANGITEICDMDVSPAIAEILVILDSERLLPIRVNVYLSGEEIIKNGCRAGVTSYHGNKLKITGTKFYADGALGSRGAAMLAPFEDVEGCGLLLTNDSELFNSCKTALAMGFDVAVHAIGDAANRLVLNVYGKLRQSGAVPYGRLLRIEHAQIVAPEDLVLFAEYDVIASMQPVHCTSDAKMARSRIGSRISNAYLWKTMLKNGIALLAGSDFPIESHSTIAGIDAFVRRTPAGESEPWLPEQRLSRNEAIAAYTKTYHTITNNSVRGKIEIGAKADINIIDTDLENCSEDEIINCNVLATLCSDY